MIYFLNIFLFESFLPKRDYGSLSLPYQAFKLWSGRSHNCWTLVFELNQKLQIFSSYSLVLDLATFGILKVSLILWIWRKIWVSIIWILVIATIVLICHSSQSIQCLQPLFLAKVIFEILIHRLGTLSISCRLRIRLSLENMIEVVLILIARNSAIHVDDKRWLI